jgi:glycosyltransferase involved in cell wall biosynthesis
MVRSLLQEKMQRAQFVVTCAETNRDELVRIGGEDVRDKIHVHRHGVDLERFHPPSSCSKPQPVWQLLACGFLASYKGFEHLVSACELLHQQGYTFLCTIIGEGPEHGRLTRQIQQARLSSQVRLLPPMPQSELVEWYHQANVFIHPSVVTKQGNRDVIPNVLVEAMASGVPVISTRLAGIQELIQADENGLLVSPGDPHALAEAIVTLMQDDKKRQRLVEAAKQSVAEDFDRYRNAEALVRTFATSISL